MKGEEDDAALFTIMLLPFDGFHRQLEMRAQLD